MQEPKIITPFDDETFKDIARHVREVRRIFDFPGNPYHDVNEAIKFNRFYWHNLPVLRALHNSRKFVNQVCDTFGKDLKPSYVFLSLYGPEGVCPLHTDRPQCQFTVDLQIESDGAWPIYIEEKPYHLEDGMALCYSGTGQAHYRKPMKEDGAGCTKMNLAFFHFVPSDWQGELG